MGLLCDYFVAPSDADAAATIDHVGGPGRPAPVPAPARRGIFRRGSSPAGPADDVVLYPTVDSGGIEPVVQMGQLEAILTGRTFDEVLDANADGLLVAQRSGGERLVVKLSAALTNALSEASTADITRVAEPWAQTEEFWDSADPAALTAFLTELSALARRARDRGEGLYCWVSV